MGRTPVFLTENGQNMKKIFLIILLVIIYYAKAQRTYLIDNFSSKYKAVLTIAPGFEKEVFKKGNISVYDKKTGEKLIDINSGELTFETDNEGNIKTNIKEVPYGEQSILMYEDFNFDGKKDLAVMDGQYSCYHCPSYRIYLETGNGLKFSPEFTRLAQDYCGMFQTDPENKRLYTMAKSGCCWHEFSEFEIKDNKPYPVKIIIESVNDNGVSIDYTEKNRKGNKMEEKNYSMLLDPSLDIFGFETKNKKKLHLIQYENQLYYAYTDKDGIIELLYKGNFVFDTNKNTLRFKNKEATYVISPEGIWIGTPHKKVFLPSSKNSIQGSLIDLKQQKIANLKLKN